MTAAALNLVIFGLAMVLIVAQLARRAWRKRKNSRALAQGLTVLPPNGRQRSEDAR